MLMLLPIAAMRVEHDDISPLEPLAPDLAKEIIHAPGATSHQRTQQDRRIVIEGRAKHRRDRQDDVAIDHPLVEHLAHLTDPVVDVDFGAPQTQRRFTTHGDTMGALPTLQTAVFDIAHLLRVATRQHLGHQALVVGRLVAGMGVGKRVPVIGKDLLKDIPVPGGGCKHPRPPSEGGRDCDGAVVVPRHLRAVHSSSTMAITAYRSNTKNENS
jgi:hypothetical protein